VTTKTAKSGSLGPAAPISQCPLWKIQEDYYRQHGIGAWDEKVPYFVTNSVVIAETYADLLVAFLQDYAAQLDVAEPVYLLELGAGIGRFGFLLLKELDRKLPYFPVLRDLKIKLVMTDFTDMPPSFWQKHERLKPFVEAGKVDFAVLHPESETSVKLRVSGQTLAPGSCKNPLVVLANYLFDSLRMDQFRIDGEGNVEECLIELFKKPTARHSTPRRTDIRDVTFEKSYRKTTPDHYPTAAWNDILKEYAANLRDACVLYPTGARQVMDNMRALSGDNLVLLSSDRGFSTVGSMVAYQDFPYDMHEGCFSHQVNYHALCSGMPLYLHTTHRQLNSIQTVFSADVKNAPSEWPHLRYAFNERLDRTNAVNTLAAEAFGLVADRQDTWSTCLLAFVRMNLFDPNAFTAVAKRIVPIIPKLTLSERMELLMMLDQIWDNHYQFKGAVKAPFWLGHLYYELGVYDRALFFLEKTAEIEGDDDVLCYLRACCHDAMGAPDKARTMLKKALKHNAGLAEARDMLNRLGG